MSARDAAGAEAAALLDLIEAKWTTQAIGVAAELGIADRIAAGTRDADSLAQALACDPPALRRLLRALASLRLLVEDAQGRYALTTRGELLRDDTRPTLRAWARWGASQHWGPWGDMLAVVREGQKRGGYRHLEDDPAKAAVFNRAMTEVTALVAGALTHAFDFGPVKRVVDVGGGYGELLRALLAAHPYLAGTLYDLPHAIEGARAAWAGSPLEARCTLATGSFFEAIPAGADLYVMKSIVHNWDDARAGAILRTCRAAMAREARLLLVERIMPERMGGSEEERRAVRADLNMLVTHAGGERTRAEFAALLAGAGLRAHRFEPLAVGFSFVEAHPA